MEFTEAIAPSTWTFPSVTSTLKGEMPHEHGAVAHTMPEDDSFAIPEQVEAGDTLPELFEAAGYDTLGLFGFPMPFMATKGWFESHRVWADEPAENVLDYYLKWRDGRDSTFAYIQLSDLHAPLGPPEGYVDERDVDMSLESLPSLVKYTDSYDGSEDCSYYREHRLRLYRAALDYVEDCYETVTKAVGDETLIVTFGDHGEAHWEHYDIDRKFTDSRPNYGVGHGGTPLDMVARVPVGVNDGSFLPNGGWASLIDISTTLSTNLLDSSIGSGENWVESIPEDRAVVCEGVRYGPERKAVYQEDRKLIRSQADDVTLPARVLDTDEEFEENLDCSPLQKHIPDAWGEGRGDTPGQIVEDQLEALGYK